MWNIASEFWWPLPCPSLPQTMQLQHLGLMKQDVRDWERTAPRNTLTLWCVDHSKKETTSKDGRGSFHQPPNVTQQEWVSCLQNACAKRHERRNRVCLLGISHLQNNVVREQSTRNRKEWVYNDTFRCSAWVFWTSTTIYCNYMGLYFNRGPPNQWI